MKQERDTSATSSETPNGSPLYSGFNSVSDHGRIKLYHWDCKELLRQTPDNYYHLCIADPPYGIGESGKKNMSRGRSSAKWKDGRPKDYGDYKWDNEAPSPAYFMELKRVSKHQIIWGANHFVESIPNASSPCWIVWDKLNSGDFADAELAYCSTTSAVRVFRHLWNGFQKGAPEVRIHPTQKPVALYRWLLQNYAKKGQRILDTHLGSGSIAIACDIEGFDLVGCELDLDYIKAARHRLAVHQSAPRLFDATPAGLPQQLSLGDDVLSDGA